MVRVVRATQLEIETAVQALRNGELVAFPTETVYGLGAHAGHPGALRRLFEIKQRPATHPLIIHLDSPRFLSRWAREIPVAANLLAERFWPGPLTLVLPRAESVNTLVTGGQDTVAVRVPAHPMAQQLLTAFGGGIAAPSANLYGRISPTRADHVRDDFGSAVPVILDGGESKLGLESTIVACLNGSVRLLRPGSVTLSQLQRVVGEVLVDVPQGAPRVPGSHRAHYAPSTPLTIVPIDLLEKMVASMAESGVRVAVLAMRPPLGSFPLVTWINAGQRPDAYSHALYTHLRTLDKSGCARILVQELPPRDERWAAAGDRLKRASAAATEADAGKGDAVSMGVLP
jgi:L-threonylcarbamoyladenylate synthase